MVDYAIHEVHFRDDKRHILSVKIFDVNGNDLSNNRILSRENVISFLKLRKSIKTIVKINGSWNWGEDVRIINYSGQEFIRTDNNSRAEDNLGNLPEF